MEELMRKCVVAVMQSSLLVIVFPRNRNSKAKLELVSRIRLLRLECCFRLVRLQVEPSLKTVRLGF